MGRYVFSGGASVPASRTGGSRLDNWASEDARSTRTVLLGFRGAWSHDRPMKKAPGAAPRARSPAGGKKSRPRPQGQIHPVVIYPIRQPRDYSDLRELYQLVARLDADKRS